MNGGHRLAALTSLAALPVAVIFAAVGAVRNAPELALAIGGAAVTVAASWYVATRRGPVRTAAAIVAAAGFASLVVGLAAADITWWAVALVAALTLLSSITARHALGLSERDLRAAPTPGVPVGAAQKPVLLMNPRSGGGKAERFKLAEECGRRGIEAITLQPGDDLLELAESAVSRGADVIGMAGGDGSQALVASVAHRHGVAHVVVPAGTRNHFALDLGLDRDDVVGALDAFAGGVERTIDLAQVNGRVFVNNASLGLYAKIVQSPEYRDAKLRTAAAMLPDLLGPDAAAPELRYTDGDGAAATGATVILVSNNPYQLAEFGGRGTRERIDTGELGVVAITLAGAGDLQRFAGLNAAGQGRRFGGWREWSAPVFRIDADAPVEVGVDGEAMVLEPPLEFTSVPAAVRVRLPDHAPGISPAARRLEPATARDLWCVALGE